MSGLFNVCSYEDLTGVPIVGQKIFCLGATFLFFLLVFLYAVRGVEGLSGRRFVVGNGWDCE
jgi:hypothetical protein